MKDNQKAVIFRNQGNMKFNQRQFYEALVCYNKSLCFAKSGSDNSGLAYANRSAIYLEVKEIDKCLENIQLARAHKYANEAKLNEREEKAQNLKVNNRKDPENDTANFFKLSYPANERNPSIVNCLEVYESQQFGRYVITNKDLNPGDILVIEEPMFKTTSFDGRFLRCSNCFKSNLLSLVPCDGDCHLSK
jgi:SET and MYND domain-containing protein 4